MRAVGQRPSMNPRSVLIVDDDAEMCEVMKQVLEGRGYQVACAADGVEASKAISGTDFDLVITDLIMPEKDGIQLMNEIRRKYPRVRVVAMSGGGHVPRDQYLRIARGLGADAVLEKPFHNDALLEVVEKTLAK